jgi:hypothetical protein
MASPTDSTELNPNVLKMAVKFLKTELIEKIVYYQILINDLNSRASWITTARYSFLLSLHKKIRKEYEGPLPEFPPKKCCGNTNPEFISLRQKALENYLNIILKIINVDLLPSLKEFLMNSKQDSRPSVRKETDCRIGSEDDTENRGGFVYFSRNEKFSKFLETISNRFIDLGADLNLPFEEDPSKKIIYRNISNRTKFDISKSTLLNQSLPNSSERSESEKKILNRPSLYSHHDEVLFVMDDSIKKIESRIRNLSGAITHFNIVHTIINNQS